MPLKAVLFRRASGDVVVLAVVVSVMDTVTEDVVVAEVSVLRRGRHDVNNVNDDTTHRSGRLVSVVAVVVSVQFLKVNHSVCAWGQ